MIDVESLKSDYQTITLGESVKFYIASGDYYGYTKENIKIVQLAKDDTYISFSFENDNSSYFMLVKDVEKAKVEEVKKEEPKKETQEETKTPAKENSSSNKDSSSNNSGNSGGNGNSSNGGGNSTTPTQPETPTQPKQPEPVQNTYSAQEAINKCYMHNNEFKYKEPMTLGCFVLPSRTQLDGSFYIIVYVSCISLILKKCSSKSFWL